MTFLGRSNSNTHEVKSAKVGLASRGPRMSRKQRKAAAEAAATASAMSAATTDDYYSEPTYTSARDYGRSEPRMGDLTVGDYANGMPRIRLGEFFSSFSRQLKWVVPLFLVGTIGAWFLTKDFKRTYSGEGRVLVQLGDEYVFESVTPGQQQSLQLTPDHIVLNEIGIMKNADIIEQVVGEMVSRPDIGEKRFAEEAFKKINGASGADRINAQVELYSMIESNYAVMPKPKSSIVDLSFKHEDPEIAVQTLNMFIEKYLEARKALFVYGSSDDIAERRRSTAKQLDANEAKIANFLRKNGVSDFDSERSGVTQRTEELRTQLNTLRSDMTETERALSTVEQQLRSMPEQIDLYVDDRASQRIAQAELELKQLLAKYVPGSRPVRQKQSELNELKSLIASNAGRAAGGRRVGPNPVYQSTLQNRNGLQSRADSLREKEYVLQSQLDAADAKVRRLQDISPTYASLLRDRDTLNQRLRSYTSKEQEALVNQEQAESSSENVRVISYATRPRKGRNMRLVMFALATVGWGFTLFVLAMMKVFLDPKLYATPQAATLTARVQGGRRADDYSQYGSPRDYSIPEGVPASATAFAATPYDTGQYDSNQAGYAPAVNANPYGAQPYHAGQNYETAYNDANTQQTMAHAQPAYGNAAEDIYANPYAQAAAPAEGYANTDVDVLGTVPTERN